MTPNQNTLKQEARARLKLLSTEVKNLVEDGTFYTINDAIMETLYRDSIHRQFKSYRQWKKEGFLVRKGEKAFLLWAKPSQMEPKESSEGHQISGDAVQDLRFSEPTKFFPMAYLFSNAQVEKAEDQNLETVIVELKPKMALEPMPYG